MDFQIDKEAETIRRFSYENSSMGVYCKADLEDLTRENRMRGFNIFFATW